MASDNLSTLAPPLPKTRSTFTAFRFILLLGLLDAFGPLGIDMYLPAFPQIRKELGAKDGQLELTLSLFLAGLAVGQLICGPISDRLGRRVPLLYGAGAFAVASVICAFTRSIEALILARFVMGLAGATGMVIARAVVRDSFEESESSRVYSMLMLVIGIAPIISPSVGGFLMELGGWGTIFWALAAFGCLCGLFVAIDLPETHPPSKRTGESLGTVARTYAGMIVNPKFVGYALPVALALGMIFAYVASAPLLFMEYYGVSKGSFSLIFATIAIGLIGVAQVNRALTRRYDTHVILRGASLVNVAAALVLPVLAWTGLGGFPAFYAALFVCLGSVGLILPNATAAVMAPFAERAGAASALLGMLQFAVGAAVAAVVGKCHDGTPRPMALAMAACAVVAATVTIVSEWARTPGHATTPHQP